MTILRTFKNNGDDIIQIPGGYPVMPGATIVLDDSKDDRIREIFDNPKAAADAWAAIGRIDDLEFLGSEIVGDPVVDGGNGGGGEDGGDSGDGGDGD